MMVACLVLLVAGVVSVFTHDGDRVTIDQAGDVSDSTTTTTSPPEETTAVPDDSVPETTMDAATTTTAEATTSTTRAPTTTAPPTTTSGPPTSEPVPGTTPTTPGTYTYDVDGTVDGEQVSETSTLHVPEPDARGRQAQVQEAPDGTTTTTYRFTAEGTFLEQLHLESDQGTFTLDATEPFLLVPADVRDGTVTEGTLRGDGLTAEITFTMVELGAEESTAELVADISGEASGFQVDGTMESTVTARSSDQLPLVTESTTDISAGGGIVTSTSDLRAVLRR